MRGRKESNPGPPTDPTGPAHEERTLRNHDPRLQAAWYYHPVRGTECPGWAGYRRMHGQAPSPRIPALPAAVGSGVSEWDGDASDCGQLWDSQTAQSEGMAGKAPAIYAALHAD